MFGDDCAPAGALRIVLTLYEISVVGRREGGKKDVDLIMRLRRPVPSLMRVAGLIWK